MDSVGVAVVGLDHWYSAFNVLYQVVAEPEVRLVGIADPDAQHLEEARQKYHPETVTKEYAQLLDREDVDLVFSFTSTDRNVELCHESLGRGKHTLCVKPPALTVREANELAIAAEDSGVIW